jgi:hypothetical protein
VRKAAYVLGSALILLGSATADAQTTYPDQPGFVNLAYGAQPQRRTIETSTSFPLYDETATVDVTQAVRNGGIFEIGGGYRVWKNIAVGGSISRFSRSGDGSVTAVIPDPVFFNRPATVTSQGQELDHSETGVHLQAFYFIPVRDKIDVMFSAGPSFINVTQELATVAIAQGTQNVSINKEERTGTAVGVNLGAQGNYLFGPRYAAGLFLGYAGGKVNLDDIGDLSVGGFRVGVSFQARF